MREFEGFAGVGHIGLARHLTLTLGGYPKSKDSVAEKKSNVKDEGSIHKVKPLGQFLE